MEKTSGLLADFVVSLHYADIPPHIIQATKRILLDDLGSMIGGFREPETRAMAKSLSAGRGEGSATVLGSGFPKLDPATAALANGSAGCGLETDGGYRYASCHASSYVVPTALALAETLGASGRQLIEAVIAGYEVAARLAKATSLPRPLMPHGVWSAPGAAAAAAKILSLNRAETAAAIDLAAMLTTNSAFTGRFEGATVRNSYNGLGAQTGIFAAELAKLGTRVEFDAIGKVFGTLSGDRFDLQDASQGIGTSYAIGFHYHKRWACCGFVHPSLDAIADLMADDRMTAFNIERIEISTFLEGAVLDDRAPPRPLAARHSVPWAVAALIIRGSLPPEAFAWEALEDPAIRQLAALVNVRCANDLPSGFSNERSAHVRVVFRDGSEREHICRNIQGDFSTPFPDSAIQTKFLSLAGPTLSPASASQFADLVLSIEQLDDIGRLLGALQADKSRESSNVPARRNIHVKTMPKPITEDYLDGLVSLASKVPSTAELAAAGGLLARHDEARQKGRYSGEDRSHLDGCMAFQGSGLEAAALRNGFCIAMEIDDFETGQSGVVITGAALSLATSETYSQDQLQHAVASGTKIAVSLRNAVAPRAAYGDAGIFGLLGAAMTCSLLKGFDVRMMRETLNVAASLTLATPANTGARALAAAHIAEASFRAVFATTLIEAGYTGLRDGLGFTLGTLIGEDFDKAGFCNGSHDDLRVEGGSTMFNQLQDAGNSNISRAVS